MAAAVYLIRKIGVSLLSAAMFSTGQGQKIFSEGTLTYKITATATGGNQAQANGFDRAMQTIHLRGNLCRVDFSSRLRKQVTIINANTGEAILMRETEGEKYLWNLTATQWEKYFYAQIKTPWQISTDTKEYGGYFCKHATALTHKGDTMVVYFTQQINPLVKKIDPLTAGLNGVPVWYEIKNEEINIQYTLTEVKTTPVSVMLFKKPEGDYKVMRVE